MQCLFENSVILYGSKTNPIIINRNFMFENSVILYGSKTENAFELALAGLRIV